ncbi:MAG: 23S rRNA (adenine(2503)-C(2))-methyltransferase RlmN [Erysipelotrichaceae bacterium]|nr:23S rRNA (adenine(2503)-C(2))-methyltransferase RlmN [Erysipelotrichaceae bacterium]
MNYIYDYSLKDLENYFVEKGLKPYKAKQVFKWLYEKRIHDFDLMSDLSKDLIETLKDELCISRLNIVKSQKSKDGTIKFLFELHDGSLIESVLMHFDYGYSACISSQVGCNMGCSFCASGLLKKQRDLQSGEIVLQILMLQEELDKQNLRLGNIVVMGTGEPFDNYDNLMKALAIVNDPFGLAIGSRHISISTCGLVPMIERFAKENVQYNLAVSLHAATDELRNKLMPINKAYNLDKLMSAIKYYSELNNRRITFEYLLLNDVNDREEDAKAIKKLIKGLNAYINLIPYNEVEENEYQSVNDEKALRFYDMLKKEGVAVTLRQKRGTDIDAACGQLRAKEILK